MTENKIYNATIKAGTAYDAPWLTVSGQTAGELAFNLKAVEDQGLPQLIADTARQLAGFWTASSTLGATPVAAPAAPQQAYSQQVAAAQAPALDAPQQAYQQQQNYQQNPPQAPPVQPWQNQPQQAAPQQGGGARPQPEGPPPVCAHGPMLWKAGISSKTNNPYAFWACNTPQSDPNKCKTVWPK